MDLGESPKGKVKDLSPASAPLTNCILLEESSALPEGGGGGIERARCPLSKERTTAQREQAQYHLTVACIEKDWNGIES